MIDIYVSLGGDHRPVCASCQTPWPCAAHESLTTPHRRLGGRCERCLTVWPCTAAVLAGPDQINAPTPEALPED